MKYQNELHGMIDIVNNTKTSTSIWLAISKARSIHPNVNVTISIYEIVRHFFFFNQDRLLCASENNWNLECLNTFAVKLSLSQSSTMWLRANASEHYASLHYAWCWIRYQQMCTKEYKPKFNIFMTLCVQIGCANEWQGSTYKA